MDIPDASKLDLSLTQENNTPKKLRSTANHGMP